MGEKITTLFSLISNWQLARYSITNVGKKVTNGPQDTKKCLLTSINRLLFLFFQSLVAVEGVGLHQPDQKRFLAFRQLSKSHCLKLVYPNKGKPENISLCEVPFFSENG